MNTFKSILVGYLCITSVLLHLLFIAALFFLLIPAFSSGRKWADEMARAHEGQPEHVATVQDVSVLEDGDSKYVGYAVEYNGQPLYLMGGPISEFAKGEKVALLIQKPPFSVGGMLLVTPLKIGQ